MSFSFSFSKKVRDNTVKDSILRDDSTKEVEEEREYVNIIEEIQFERNASSPGEKRELTIPLIAKNNWRQENEKTQEQKGSKRDRDNSTNSISNSGKTEIKHKKSKIEDPTFNTPDNLTRQAVKELLDSVGESTNKTETIAIPLLLQNKAPFDLERDKLGVSLRPDSSSLEDYERVPIEDFGMAMLRGMNWSKEEGIGLTNKSYVELVEPQPRARGLGLGATAAIKIVDSSDSEQ